MDPLSPEDRTHLESAAADRYSGLDLRYEGGPWVAELDRLAALGLLTIVTHDQGYMVSYRITDAGRKALAAQA